tara:strand:- start:2054 stop:3259 length:1206 start_codon:yes stop_codon:yes gene_type:complete
MSDLYKILDINKNASDDEVKKAYRKMAMKHHPDKGGSDEKFKEISEAYEILSNSEKRNLYDKFGMDAVKNTGRNGNMPGNAYDIFNSFFGNDPFNGNNNGFGDMFGHRPQQQKEQIIAQINVSLEQIYKGCKLVNSIQIDVKCSKCSGTGSKSGKDTQCKECDGSGTKVHIAQMGPMIQKMMAQCNHCNGSGTTIKKSDICNSCKGSKFVKKVKELNIDLKPGTENDDQIYIENQGYKNGVECDIILIIKIDEHPIYKRINKNDILIEHRINLLESLTGGTYKLKHLKGNNIYFKSNNIINPNKTYCLVNQGLQMENGSYGDLLIKFIIEYPDTLITGEDSIKLNNILNQSTKQYEIDSNKILYINETKKKYNDQYSNTQKQPKYTRQTRTNSNVQECHQQ